MNKFLIVIIALILFVIGIYFINQYYWTSSGRVESLSSAAMPTLNLSPDNNQSTLALPIDQFKTRVTKKPFGIYVNPQNSPVQPERFTGFHTAADVEYEDVFVDVPVFALSEGTVMLATTASGYGGVLMLRFNLNGIDRAALYGHLRPDSMPQVGKRVLKGEKIGVLGTSFSKETDMERRHLHFAILTNDRTDLKGYVQTKEELTLWIDPLTLYN